MKRGYSNQKEFDVVDTKTLAVLLMGKEES